MQVKFYPYKNAEGGGEAQKVWGYLEAILKVGWGQVQKVITPSNVFSPSAHNLPTTADHEQYRGLGVFLLILP